MKSLARIRRSVRRFVLGNLNEGIEPLGYRILEPLHRAQAKVGQARYAGTYIAVTGSVGKSTTTHLASELLRAYGSVAAGVYWGSAGSVQRTLRKLRAPTDYVVQEVSGHVPGAIRRATSGLGIDVAVVTAIGLDHYSTFRTLENIALEKGVLVASLRPGGVACLNANDPTVAGLASLAPGRVVFFGTSARAEVRGENPSALWPERLCFDLVVGGVRTRVRTRFAGTLMLTNILGALAVVQALGLPLGPAIERLSTLEPQMRRQMVVSGSDDPHTYVVDTFKASLWSTRLLAADLPNWGDARKIVVLGDVSDLGNDPSRKCRSILRAFADSCDLVIGYGISADPARKLRERGAANIASAASLDDVASMLRTEPPSLVILKAIAGSSLEALLPPDRRVLDIWRQGKS